MAEISSENRTHDELHRDHPVEYNRIIDLDHDIKLIDDHDYPDKLNLVQGSVNLRATLASGDMTKFEEDYNNLKRKVDRAPKI